MFTIAIVLMHEHRYREARREGRWQFDCPRNDEDWVYDRFFRVALVGDVGTGKVPTTTTPRHFMIGPAWSVSLVVF
jgi:hypothetical protein